MDQAHEILKKYWGYKEFRPLQSEIIRSVLDQHDTLGLMPTGGGKSLTFQVPALCLDGVCLVVTPLIALMKDQVMNLHKRGIKALAVHSGMSRDEISVALDNAVFGGFKLLYVSPERLASTQFRERLGQMNVSLIAVDEAHCISQWGYDFRPSYIKIAAVREWLPEVPVLALTATATPKVVEDIQEKLLFSKKNVFRKSFERSNLAYVVRQSEDKETLLVKMLNSLQGSAIVYVRNRKRTRDLAQFLVKSGFSAGYFHAGLDYEVRDELQRAWTQNKIRVMVATNAFGMGIDKPDVRLVVHMEAPDSLEAYFQEAGRAGRDETKAFAVLIWSNHDKSKLHRQVTMSFPEKEEVRRVYEALGNFFQVAVGSGYLQTYDFNIARFCHAYGFQTEMVLSSLKILERAGYIEFSEDLRMPSRIHFLLERDDLYKFQVANKELDNFIKLLLRSYTGLFTDYVSINEDLLAMRASVDRNGIYQYLLKLSNLKVIRYIPQRKGPQITYLQSREEGRHVILGKEIYHDRKENYATRVEAVIDYATQMHVCRSKVLLNYFGQSDSSNCGVCDVCIERKKNHLDDAGFEQIEQGVKSLLQNGPHSLSDLQTKLETTAERLNKVIRWLEEYEMVAFNDQDCLEWIGRERGSD